MVTNNEILASLDSVAPFNLAMDWDNVGLLLDMNGPSQRILFALDLTAEVVMEARAKGCGAIVCHHPAIFGPGLRKLESRDPIVLAATFGISVFAAHTNWDAAKGGVNDVLAGLFGLASVENFGGIGRMGTCTDCSPDEFARRVKKALGITAVQLESSGVLVNKVAVVGGSGGDFVGAAAAAGCQMLVTGECKHHEALLARRLGISVISAGHYETENPSMYYLASALSAALGGKAECLLFEGSMPIFRTV